MDEKITLNKAVSLFGSRAELARALGITRSAVSQWDAEKPIPEKQALKIRYALKPDAFQKSQ